MRNKLFFIALLMLATSSMAGKKFYHMDREAMCSGAKVCLNKDIATCTVEEKKKNSDITYDNEFCAPFRELDLRGLNSSSALALEIYSYLGKEYRVTYKVGGQLPINTQMMDYLMNHMPFASRMINAYQGTKYSLIYTGSNKRDFKADNGNNLAGMIKFAAGDSSGHRNVFFGHGKAKVLMWKLYGVALVFLDYNAKDKSTLNYELRSIVFPANAMLNGVMNMGVFKNVVKDKMFEIIGHVEKSASAYGSGNLAPIQKSKDFKSGWTKQDLDGFNAVIKSSGWTPAKK